MNQDDDPEIALIKARKLKRLREHAAMLDKIKQTNDSQVLRQKTDREVLSSLLYDRADEVLRLAESQYPSQTRLLIKKIAQLINEGEITSPISGGELLALFRYAGLRIRVNTQIKIDDHGKFISFSDKLKKENE
jgi:DNA-binding TFAR19-related protein (PDSD5 family)